ncbi:hypothetical protein G7B40_006695 [Aetokthonos hydrillicola Thurmond2011]|jgi:hypothetical protein|uniref:Uncharacterized protein n=1 Tax=Aetokthonos hydrillicola Thurmond2011 TaxID=2712845 RepID=A0AAP5M9D4_9CYAN|nr:hypothetical protein [Aetokthonos hydrillicola]MDR9894259.1 hypothetical protein [Aetokthonos hydrillicola Thurmond2011]
MTYYPLILADSWFLFAYYSARDKYHEQAYSPSCSFSHASELSWLDVY